MKLLFLSGSSSIGSANWRLASATAQLVKRSFGHGVEPIVADLLQFELPSFERSAVVDHIDEVHRLRAMFDGVAGIFMGSDEYTGSYSAILKNAIGWLQLSSSDNRTPFDGMQVALCGVSSRGAGGLRGQPALQQLLQELGAIVTTQYLDLGTSESPFDEEGVLLPKIQRQLLNGCLQKLCGQTNRAEITSLL